MGVVNGELKPHCIIFPLSVQGHINPMLQFSKRLLHKDIEITLVITKHLAKTTLFSSDADISLETISDGFDDGKPPGVSHETYFAKLEEVGSATLRELIQRLAGSGRPVDCVVFDPFMPWASTVAKELGVYAAAFFTQSVAVDHIYRHVYDGDLKVPPASDEILIPGLPPLRPEDLPSFVTAPGFYMPYLEVVVNQFRGLDNVDWLFFNTFYELEQQVIDYISQLGVQAKAIGPTIPSMYLDKRLANDKEYGLSVFKPLVGDCMEWLDKQQPQSVVYVSFGSLAQLSDKQMEELAWALKLSNKNFFWVVRESELCKIPNDFAKDASVKDLIVTWCPQLDVLSHEAICCFVTHCGWNSTLEALSLGVPMVAMPQWTDQTTNAKFIVDVWKTGIKAIEDGDGLVNQQTIASCIRKIVDGERGKEIKKNVTKWKELARRSMAVGGNSDLNTEEFISTLRSNSKSTLLKKNT